MRDRTNVRALALDDVGEPVDLVVADLSFISLRLVLDALVRVLRPEGDLVLLVKPQFEAGRAAVSKGRGIVTDPQVWHDSLAAVLDACTAHGVGVRGLMPSPVTGTGGNVEFLLAGRPAGADQTVGAGEAEALVAAAVAEVTGTRAG